MHILNRADANVARLSSVFQQLADPTRMRVFCALVVVDGAQSIDGLAAAVGVSRTTVNRHLAELARMGLVTAERRRRLNKQFALHPIVRSPDGLLNLGRGVRIACCGGDCAGE